MLVTAVHIILYMKLRIPRVFSLYIHAMRQGKKITRNIVKRISSRRNEHQSGFPDFMDLLVVCADSGLSMEAVAKTFRYLDEDELAAQRKAAAAARGQK